MPIYEYVCKECGTPFEELVLSISKEKEVICPNCESKNVQKKISLFGTQIAKSGGALSSSSCTTST
jgi:putative FmdB family regulatory protein